MPILDAAWVPGDNARRLRSEQAEEPQENEDEGYGGYAQLFEGINNEDNKDEEDHKYEEIPDPHAYEEDNKLNAIATLAQEESPASL